MRTAVVLASLSLALFACRGGDDGGGDDTTGDDGPGDDGDINAGVVDVVEIQNDAMAPGTQVELRGVVVLAIDRYGDRQGDIWVGDPGGGAYSGVKVYGAPIDVVALLNPGDLVNITGAEKEEFKCTVEICNSTFDGDLSITEIRPVSSGSMTVTVTGQGTLPTPATVDALAISMMADENDRNAEWEKWEGVLINVINARAFEDPDPFSDGNDDQIEIPITGGAKVQTVLAPFHADAVIDTCFGGITGVGDFFFDYLVLPTSEAATMGGGNGCAALPVYTTATIPDIQAGTATGDVQVVDAYITAVSFNGRNFWISQDLAAATNEGLYVRISGSAPTGAVIGARVTAKGTVAEFNNTDTGGGMTGDTLTQLTGARIVVNAAPTTAPTPLAVADVSTLTTAATGEEYEGTLVTLSNVKLTTLGGADDYISTFTQAGGDTFKADDEIYRLVAADDDKCYSSLTGIWSYNVYTNEYVLQVRKALTGSGPDGVVAANATDCD